MPPGRVVRKKLAHSESEIQETVSQTKINSAGNGSVFHVDYNRKICKNPHEQGFWGKSTAGLLTGTMSTFRLVRYQLSKNFNRREVPCHVKDIFKRETY